MEINGDDGGVPRRRRRRIVANDAEFPGGSVDDNRRRVSVGERRDERRAPSAVAIIGKRAPRHARDGRDARANARDDPSPAFVADAFFLGAFFLRAVLLRREKINHVHRARGPTERQNPTTETIETIDGEGDDGISRRGR